MATSLYRQFPKSTSIKSVSFRPHDGRPTGTLRVKFRNGSTYQYGQVGTGVMAEFLIDAVSMGAGRSYLTHIRGGGYQAKRLAPRHWACA